MAPAIPSSLTDLPDEIIDKLFATLIEPSDVAALTYSCRRFWLLAEPNTYGSIVIRDRSENIAIRSALTVRPQRAAVVQKLSVSRSIEWQNEEDDVDWQDDSELSILPMLENLKVYSVEAGEPEDFSPLQVFLEHASDGHAFKFLKTCTIRLLHADNDDGQAGDMEPLGALFAIPSLEDLTIRGCFASDFSFLDDDPSSAVKPKSTALRRLRWLQGDLTSQALEQMLCMPSRLEELAIQISSAFRAPDGTSDGCPRDWNEYIHTISKRQPELQCLYLDTDLDLGNDWFLYLDKLTNLKKFVSLDTLLFSTDPAGFDAPLAKLLPQSLETLALACNGDYFGPICSIIAHLKEMIPGLKTLKYSVYREKIPSKLWTLCEVAGIKLESLDLTQAIEKDGLTSMVEPLCA
ncbi:MAG: hypothetical protein M1821_001703 [Bathelium mastoideum]|nr:MAG: hypothetical protein M1821_001703 [Bathelium mastoideum]KAI9691596.1 MAG: hypothetical protein M1822_007667 [Bathelium mastoideum]